MNIDLVPFAVIWALLASVVLVLIVYRLRVARQEDDTLHVMQATAAAQQTTLAHKLDTIDRWGKILTVVTVLFGLAVAGLYLYQSFVRASTTLG